MRKLGLTVLLTVVILISGFGMSISNAASNDLIAAARKEGTVVVYHSASRKAVKAVAERFEKKYGIKVHWTRKPTGGITRMFAAERMAGALKCDIVSVGDPSTFIRWKSEKALMKYVSPESSAYLKRLVDPDGFSVPDRADYMSIGYNPKKVSKSELPKDWTDILDPKWKGRVATIDPAKSGPARLWVAAMVQKYGWDFFKKFSKQKPLVLKSYSTSAVALVSGEADLIVPGNESDILKRRMKGEPVDNVYPAGGLVFRSARVGICARAPHPNAAKLWINYESSAEGQTLMQKVRGYIPIRRDVKITISRPAKAVMEDNLLYVDDKWFLKNKKKMIKTFSKIMSGKN